jgi:hypothetical protein
VPAFGTIVSEPGDTVTISVGAACYYLTTLQPQPVGNPAPDPLVGPTQPQTINEPVDQTPIATVPSVSVPNPLPPSVLVPAQATRLEAGLQIGFVVATEGV